MLLGLRDPAERNLLDDCCMNDSVVSVLLATVKDQGTLKQGERGRGLKPCCRIHGT